MAGESSQAQHTIKGWLFQDSLLEFYRYAPCPPEWMPTHTHSEYQFCLSLDCPGEYYYRGTHYWVPTGSISVIHPGEIHTGRDIDDRQTYATFRMMYLSLDVVNAAVLEIAESDANSPFFADPIILDPHLAKHFLNFHSSSQGTSSRLEQDSLLLSLLTQFILHYGDTAFTPRLVKEERKAVHRVRDYLQENYAEDVTLDRLSQIAELSSYYLSRVFRAEVGILLHQYQTQIRVERAKMQLAQGVSIQQVAVEVGFVDQSHLTRHFKRFVGITPGKYRLRDRKNRD